VLERSESIIRDFLRAPQVENSRHPELVPDDRDVAFGQLLKAVTAKDTAKTRLSSVNSAVPAEVPKVDRAR
jgi:hypothetical protein